MKKVIYVKKNNAQQQELTGISRFFFYFVVLFLIVLLVGLLFVHSVLVQKRQALTLSPRYKNATIAAYPFFLQPIDLQISAQSAVIMEDASKAILFQKNPNLRFSTASTAKIMTALVALDYFRPNDVITVMSEGFEGTVVGMQKGEKFYFDDIFASMLLASGNDAALTIAENYPGGVETFVLKMNEKAKSLHLSNTHFADPAGLDDDGNYTTAIDLARLSSAAMKDKTFARTVGTRFRSFLTVSGTNTYEVSNLNQLLGSYGVVGIKTGRTLGAGEVLTTAKMENGKLIIIVVMQSNDRFFDTETMLNKIGGNVGYFTPKTFSY